jgi:serine/threonine kinase 32
MGLRCSRRPLSPSRTQLTDFTLVRAIGRGAFGKVCIVFHRGMKKHYALKYMAKRRLVMKSAAFNVLRELEMLRDLRHPFIVNLWFTFQDDRYLYMVNDLYVGGDLRYHLNEMGKFSEAMAKLYVYEIALALQYLHDQRIIHRDVKLDNVLLDEQGHAHLADFNLATLLEDNTLATSFSGTRPYMAPEILSTALGLLPGYDHRVDWYSLGVCLYEMLRGRRPFDYPSSYSSLQVLQLVSSGSIALPANWPSDLIAFVTASLCVDPNRRINSLNAFRSHQYMKRIPMEQVLERKMAPAFVPKKKLNCDLTYELEECIVESSPLHRRRRNAPQSSNAASNSKSQELLVVDAVQQMTNAFKPFNRFRCDPPYSQTAKETTNGSYAPIKEI